MNYVKYIRNMVGKKPIILTGAVTIIYKDDEILLQKRKALAVGNWGLVGGLMELGESTEETAKREAFEEANLTLENLELVTVHSGEKSYIKVENGDEFYCVTVCYATNQFSGNLIVDPSESYEMKFFKMNDLPKSMVKSHLEMLEVFMENRK